MKELPQILRQFFSKGIKQMILPSLWTAVMTTDGKQAMI